MKNKLMSELGCKMVNWHALFGFVHCHASIIIDECGYNEDYNFYGYRVLI